MRDELSSLEKIGTWILVDTQKLINYRWIFKKNIEMSDKERVRYKARLVARGFTRREGIDFNEVFSSMVKHCSIRILLTIIAQRDLELHQLDVKQPFYMET